MNKHQVKGRIEEAAGEVQEQAGKLSDTTSRVTVQIDWQPTGILERLGGTLGVDNHAIKKDLKSFKQYIEAKGSADGAWRGDVQA